MNEMPGRTYDELDKEWKTTSKLVFGGEVGKLSDYREWLIELNNPRFVRKSSISGIETVFSSSEFGSDSRDSRFISMDEIDFNRKFEPLSINEIKDIDSVIEAVSERIYYCGNIVLGNSKYVEKSSNVSDSFFVYDSVKISDCKTIAYSQYLRLCENIFGTNEGGESKYCIRCCILFKNARCFELWRSTNCSDCYYSYGIDSCQDTMFSFNIKGKRNVIGNLALPRDKYSEIKKKLLSEMRERLVKEKKLPSLVEITSDSNFSSEITKVETKQKTTQKNEFEPIETAFRKTSSILFRKQLPESIERYADWLGLHNVIPYNVESVLSKKPVLISKWPGIKQLPKNRLVTMDEGEALANLTITESEANRINLENAGQIIGRIAYYPTEQINGVNSNLINCQWGTDATNCYNSVICVYSKNCAYCSWPRSSEYCFGCGIAFDCAFSMKCYDSVKLARCFEVDGGRGCTDTYFSHNVESLQQSAFCFNTKNKQYAIGNAEVGKDKYAEFKKMMQEWIYEKLEREKKLLDVYSIKVHS